MKLKIDGSRTAAYLYTDESYVGAYGRSYSTEAIVDLDANGRIVGIELVSWQGGVIDNTEFIRVQ